MISHMVLVLLLVIAATMIPNCLSCPSGDAAVLATAPYLLGAAADTPVIINGGYFAVFRVVVDPPSTRGARILDISTILAGNPYCADRCEKVNMRFGVYYADPWWNFHLVAQTPNYAYSGNGKAGPYVEKLGVIGTTHVVPDYGHLYLAIVSDGDYGIYADQLGSVSFTGFSYSESTALPSSISNLNYEPAFTVAIATDVCI